MLKCLAYLIFASLLSFSIFISFSEKTNAADLNEALIRLERIRANTNTPGLVCINPATTASEGQIAITFPSDFAVNTTASNWTVNTSNLPAGATPWPGIGTALSISSKTVTFPSGDLTPGTFYCFNFSGVNTLTTGAAGDKSGLIATRTGGGTEIDNMDYGITIKNTDQVTVSATVPANPTDFEVEMAVINSANQTFNEGEIITYKINFYSYLSGAEDLTLEADWSLGSIGNPGNPATVNVVEYVIGSASDAYNGTPPVIDTVNRTISWDITSFPPDLDNQSVTFSLRTVDNYRGASEVYFSANSRFGGLDSVSPDATVTKKYLYSAYDPGAPQITTSPTQTTTTISPESPSVPTEAEESQFSFTDIEMEAVGVNTAKVGIRTNNPSSLELRYGSSLDDLNQTINSLTSQEYHSLEISDLEAGTRYYFRIEATDNTGNTITSDFYSFQTALTSTGAPEISPRTLILLANNKVLFSPSTDFSLFSLDDLSDLSDEVFAVLSTTFPFEFRIGVEEHENITRMYGFVRKVDVLGINTFTETLPPESDIELFEISPGVYSGRLLTKQETGIYDVFIRIYDALGNITEQKIARIKVVEPLKVISENVGSGIENAKVTLYSYNTKTQLFSFIPPDTYPIENPARTEPDGTLRLALPKGIYRAEIEAIGYKAKSVDFTIGEFPEEKYPTVELDSEAFNFLTVASYYLSTIGDVFNQAVNITANFSQSYRFFDLVAAASLALLFVTTVFSFSVRTHIPLQYIPLFLIFHIRHLFSGHSSQKYIHGEILDQADGKSLSRAKVSIFDNDTHKLLGSASTNQAGEFYLKRERAKNYRVEVVKDGYNKFVIPDYSEHALVGRLQFFIENQEDTTSITPSRIVIRGFENLFGITFETLLLISLFFELVFISTLGVWKTVPFLIVTLLTLIMWIFYASRILRKVISPSY